MDRLTKSFLGLILGEVYRIQKRIDLDMCPVNDGTIYGLLKGFESVIDEQLESLGVVTTEDLENVTQVMLKYFDDEGKKKEFRGFYTIEDELADLGINRSKAIRIFNYFKASDPGLFTDLIEKMDSAGSPVECRKFELSDVEK